MTTAPGDPGPVASGAPGLFGLDAEQNRVLGALFAEAAGALGLDGPRIFAALSRGESLARALALPSGVADALYARAHGWFAAGRPDRAEPLFRVLCVLDSRDADYWVGYGVCLRRSETHPEGETDAEAELAFATAAAIRPDWGVPRFHAAGLAIKRGQWAIAGEHLDAFRERQAGTPDAMRREANRMTAALARRAALRIERGRP